MARQITLENALSRIAFAAAQPVNTKSDLDLIEHQITRLAQTANDLCDQERSPNAVRILEWVAAIEQRLFTLPAQVAAAADRIGDVLRCAEAGARGEQLPREMRRR